MYKQLLTTFSTGLLALSFALPAGADDNSRQAANDGRRLAMVLPRAPKSLPVTVQAKRAPEPVVEFASKPRVAQRQPVSNVPDNVREVLIDAAQKAEQLSRSYNRRVADVIFWLANSMRNSNTFTPAAGPALMPGRHSDVRPVRNEHQPYGLFQID